MKPGWKTTEWWATVVANIVGAALASGAIEAGSTFDKGLGLVSMALATMGYSISRGTAKRG